jgi:hypothetical protein
VSRRTAVAPLPIPQHRHGYSSRELLCQRSMGSLPCLLVPPVVAHPPRRLTPRGNELPPIDTIPVGVHSVGRHGLLCWQGAADRLDRSHFPRWLHINRVPPAKPFSSSRRLTQAVSPQPRNATPSQSLLLRLAGWVAYSSPAVAKPYRIEYSTSNVFP